MITTHAITCNYTMKYEVLQYALPTYLSPHLVTYGLMYLSNMSDIVSSSVTGALKKILYNPTVLAN